EEVVRKARWVSVATEPIANWARQFNSNVSIVPMALDLAAYDRIERRTAADERIVLGWGGTAGGLRYLEALGPVLRRLAERQPILVRVISGGYGQVRLPGVPLDARPWSAATALEDLKSFDIGLAPLFDTDFER